MGFLAPFRREKGQIGRKLKRANRESSAVTPYSMGGTRNYDKVGKARSGRKRGRHRRERLAQPLAIERLDQQAVHAGGEAGLAVFGLGIGGERQDAGRRLARFGFGGADAAGGFAARPCPASARPSARDRRAQPAARAAAQDSTAASPLPAMVGRWPSRVSSARASSALISLSSATRIDKPLPLAAAAVAASLASEVSAGMSSNAASAASRAASEAARTGLTR